MFVNGFRLRIFIFSRVSRVSPSCLVFIIVGGYLTLIKTCVVEDHRLMEKFPAIHDIIITKVGINYRFVSESCISLGYVTSRLRCSMILDVIRDAIVMHWRNSRASFSINAWVDLARGKSGHALENWKKYPSGAISKMSEFKGANESFKR